jgi:hypothetical protein
MAGDKKITQLTAVATPTAADVVAIVNGGATKKVTRDNLTKHTLQVKNNFSDLASTATARTNIDADGAYWNANKIQSIDVVATAPSANNILKYNGTKWQPQADLGSTGAVWGNITGTLSNQADLVTTFARYTENANDLSDLDSTATARTNIGAANANWNANKIQDIDVSATAPTSGQVLKYNSTASKYEPATDVTDTNATKIQGIDVESTAPVSGDVIRYNSTASKYQTIDIRNDFYTESEVDTIATAKSNKASDLSDLNSTATARTNLGADNAYWNANELQSVAISATAPVAGQALKYNGTTSKWEAQTDATGSTPVDSVFSRTGAVLATANDYTLDQIGNPAVNKAFNFANKALEFNWTNPTGTSAAFKLEASANFSGDLIHIHQHTGNPGASTLLGMEASDSDVKGIVIDITSTAGIRNNQQYVSSLSGTAPFVINATAVNTNLNSDLLDGKHSTAFASATDFSAHTAATSAHGATGALVGDTDTLTLTNKTLTREAKTTQSLTDTATIAWDWSNGSYAYVTLGGNRTLGLFSNGVDGDGALYIDPNSTARTFVVNAGYNLPQGTSVEIAASQTCILQVTRINSVVRSQLQYF